MVFSNGEPEEISFLIVILRMKVHALGITRPEARVSYAR